MFIYIFFIYSTDCFLFLATAIILISDTTVLSIYSVVTGTMIMLIGVKMAARLPCWIILLTHGLLHATATLQDISRACLMYIYSLCCKIFLI